MKFESSTHSDPDFYGVKLTPESVEDSALLLVLNRQVVTMNAGKYGGWLNFYVTTRPTPIEIDAKEAP